MPETETHKSVIPIEADLFLTFRCSSDGTDYMQIATARYDTIYQVNAQSVGVTIVMTSLGTIINTIHTREEVMEAIAVARENHAKIFERIGSLAKLM